MAVTDLLPMAVGIASKLPQAAQMWRDISTISPTQAAAQNTIVSRAYIEEPLARLDITPNLLKALQSVYSGMILMLLQRSNEIATGRTVSDTMNKVYTRGMGVEAYQDVEAELNGLTSGLESMTTKNTPFLSTALEAFQSTEAYGDDGDNGGDRMSLNADTMGGTIAPPDLLPVGQVLKVTLVGVDAKGGSIKSDVLVGIRMTPYIVASPSMEVILENGHKPNFRMRWMQWKAGEISFWKDLIFQADRVRKMEAAMRADRTGAYQTFLSDTSKRDQDRFLDILYNLDNPQAMSNNLANSVIVVSEDTVKKAAASSGFNLLDAHQRQRFFNSSYVMMLAVIDPNYHQVNLYMNGFELPQHYAFTDFASKKKMDASDFLSMFQAMTGAGRSGRF